MTLEDCEKTAQKFALLVFRLSVIGAAFTGLVHGARGLMELVGEWSA